MERELRKFQNMLVDAGTGVILFAVWSVARVNIYLGLSHFIIEELNRTAQEIGISETFFLIFMASMVAGVLLFMLGTRLYIGLNAIAEGKGKAKPFAYLVLTAVLLVTDIHTNLQVFGVDRILAGEKISMELIMGICMELASVYVLLEVLISGIRVKILRKRMKE